LGFQTGGKAGIGFGLGPLGGLLNFLLSGSGIWFRELGGPGEIYFFHHTGGCWAQNPFLWCGAQMAPFIILVAVKKTTTRGPRLGPLGEIGGLFWKKFGLRSLKQTRAEGKGGVKAGGTLLGIKALWEKGFGGPTPGEEGV